MAAPHELRTHYEILQVIPAPAGWWLSYNMEDGSVWHDHPLSLALIEYSRGPHKLKFVGGIDDTGGVADRVSNFAGIVFCDGDPNAPKSEGGA